MQRKVFTEAERIKIARLHLDEKRMIKSLADEFGVSSSTISRWVIRYRNMHFSIDIKVFNSGGINGT